MAIYHCSIKIISRGKGKSAVAAAAYRAGEKLTNDFDGETHDYTHKGGVVHTEILLPGHAPAAFSDRAVLWNAVEKIEKAKNAQLAREIEIALPRELTREQGISLVREYVKEQFVNAGMCADFAMCGLSLSAKELFSSDALFFYPKTARGGGKMAGICLTLGKRREIERLYNEDARPSEIAAAVGVTTATIYRELKRGETGELDEHFRPAYSAEAAERAVRLSIRNRGRRKAEK